jgi:hypothetical protein
MEADLLRLSAVGEALAATVEQADDWDEARFVEWKRRLLEAEPRIFGLCIAFEPDTFTPRSKVPGPRGAAPDPDRDGYSLYVYRKRPAGVVVAEPLAANYRYRHQVWYTDAISRKRLGWTEPFIDLYGGDIPMVSYIGLLRRRGAERPVGVLTVDLSLEYFQHVAGWLKELDLGAGSYGFVISSEGRVISHPRLPFEQVVRKDEPSRKGDRIQDVWRDPEFVALIDSMLRHKGPAVGRASGTDPGTGRRAQFLYARFKPGDWVFVTVIPEDPQ